MMSVLRAELRKLFTVRSTYIVSILALLLTGFIAFYGIGYKGGRGLPANALQEAAMNGVMIVSIFVGIIAVLLICHEYRYNTISYTLTTANNRLKVLLAKVMVMTSFAAVFTLVAIVITALCVIFGARLGGHPLVPQYIDLFDLLWKTLAYLIGTAWVGLILGFISRSVVIAIAAYFVIPTIEPIIHALLKVSNNYLPTAAQNQILQTQSQPGMFSPLESAGVFALYLAVGWAVAVFLFLKRDAN